MIIINLTQHPATAEQIAAGVVDLNGEMLADLKALLTFDTLPTRQEIQNRAWEIGRIASECGYRAAMIGGAPFLMPPLEGELRDRGYEPMYAFSAREVEEQAQPDGSVRKVAVFRHLGFVAV